MANKFIDLGLLVQEDLIFKDFQGTEYKIPGLFTTELYIKLNKFYQEIENLDNDEEIFIKMQEIVLEILLLDTTKNIDLAYVKERFNDVRVLRIIIEITMNHLAELTNDPNLNSLLLPQKKVVKGNQKMSK